jgi:hypothetical protein
VSALWVQSVHGCLLLLSAPSLPVTISSPPRTPHLVPLLHLPLVERLHGKLEVRPLQLHQVDEADVAGAQLLHAAEVGQAQLAVAGLRGRAGRVG